MALDASDDTDERTKDAFVSSKWLFTAMIISHFNLTEDCMTLQTNGVGFSDMFLIVALPSKYSFLAGTRAWVSRVRSADHLILEFEFDICSHKV